RRRERCQGRHEFDEPGVQSVTCHVAPAAIISSPGAHCVVRSPGRNEAGEYVRVREAFASRTTAGNTRSGQGTCHSVLSANNVCISMQTCTVPALKGPKR